MDPNISLTEVDVAIPEFWANVALGALQNNAVMSHLVNRDFDTEIATRGDVVNVIKRGALAVNDKNPKTPITLQTPSDTKIPIVLDKHKEVSWLIEDHASAKALASAIDYVQDAAIVISEKVDYDLLGLYSGVATQVGTAGVDLSVSTILAARKQMNDLKCPTVGRVMVISSKDDTALLGTEQFTRANWMPENATALREGYLGRKYGFDYIMDQQVRTSGASPTSTHNLAFTRDAFVLVTRPLPAPPEGSGAQSAVVSMNGVSIRVTRSYSQKDGGMLWTLDMLYGVGGLRDDVFAVDVLC